MFSGIVETTTSVIQFVARSDVWRLVLERPASFSDLKIGDSIAVNGVCLTLEAFDETTLTFAVAGETLNITHWFEDPLVPTSRVNLERSLRLGDRIHGHLVTGHVEAMGRVMRVQKNEESQQVDIEIPSSLLPLVWKKGSLAINGVSLTINELDGQKVSVWLIPETLKRTNLASLRVGNQVTLEPDFMARAFLRQKELGHEYN